MTSKTQEEVGALEPRSHPPAEALCCTLLTLNIFPKLDLYLSRVVARCVSNTPTERGRKEKGIWKVVPKDLGWGKLHFGSFSNCICQP